MNLTTVTVIAVGLAMDAFAVSIATGATYKKPGTNHARLPRGLPASRSAGLSGGQAFRIALAFGSFQAIMPVTGWLVGLTVRNFIRDYDHWVAFVLLVFIGAKMIYESFKIKQAQEHSDRLSAAVLLILAIATSIDALAVGITFSFLLAGSLVVAVIIIGAVTFVFSYAGFYIGKSAGHFFENKIEIAGGIVLLCIGAKILFEHLIANGG
jgi:putative Mn2+ efflux pump MntP